MSAHAVRFADLVEMIDSLPLDERESLVDVVRRRIADDERRRVSASIRSARRQHRRGGCKPTTPDDLMREILA
ncbi:MAG: hypothetical protein ACHRHE_11300 [Tepidisphaerales bacterium]